MSSFTDFGLSKALVEALKRMQITAPTPIQSAAIPVALNGQDILASAQTGSGKTVAYALPMIAYLQANPQQRALILTPTRELATQVYDTLNRLLGGTLGFKTALLIGGASMFKQISSLRRRPQLIVGTPGRINDHLSTGNLSLEDASFWIIDEADRMLDMGFGIQIDKIAEYLPSDRQTLMFSATLPTNIVKLSQRYLRNPQRISIDFATQPAPKIKQEIIRIPHSEKFSQLLKELEQREGTILIFVKTRRLAERMSKELRNRDLSADTIHGDLTQRRRDTVIQAFRKGQTRILVATDIAARGLDVPHIMHVINYDLPQCPEDYIHRIGRTGRAGAEGSALCLICPDDNSKWKAILRMLDPQTEVADDKKHEQPKKPNQRPQKRSFGRPYNNRFGNGKPKKKFART